MGFGGALAQGLLTGVQTAGISRLEQLKEEAKKVREDSLLKLKRQYDVEDREDLQAFQSTEKGLDRDLTRGENKESRRIQEEQFGVTTDLRRTELSQNAAQAAAANKSRIDAVTLADTLAKNRVIIGMTGDDVPIYADQPGLLQGPGARKVSEISAAEKSEANKAELDHLRDKTQLLLDMKGEEREAQAKVLEDQLIATGTADDPRNVLLVMSARTGVPLEQLLGSKEKIDADVLKELSLVLADDEVFINAKGPKRIQMLKAAYKTLSGQGSTGKLDLAEDIPRIAKMTPEGQEKLIDSLPQSEARVVGQALAEYMNRRTVTEGQEVTSSGMLQGAGNAIKGAASSIADFATRNAPGAEGSIRARIEKERPRGRMDRGLYDQMIDGLVQAELQKQGRKEIF